MVSFKLDVELFKKRKSPPVGLNGMRIFQLFLEKNYGIFLSSDQMGTPSAGKGIIMRDGNNYKMKIDGKVATIGRRGVLYTLLPRNFDELGLKKDQTLGIVGDTPTQNASIRSTHYFLVTEDRDDDKQWDVVGMVDKGGDYAIYPFEDTATEFLRISEDFMSGRIEKKMTKRVLEEGDEAPKKKKNKKIEVVVCSSPPRFGRTRAALPLGLPPCSSSPRCSTPTEASSKMNESSDEYIPIAVETIVSSPPRHEGTALPDRRRQEHQEEGPVFIHNGTAFQLTEP